MNFDVSAIWSAVRYVVVAVGAFVVGLGYATADDWAALLTQLDTVVAGLAGIIAAAVGVISRLKLILENVKK